MLSIYNRPLHTIHLHGHLGAKYGRTHRLAVDSPAEAVRALSFRWPDLPKTIEEGYYRLMRRGGQGRCKREYDKDELLCRLGDEPCDFHIIPVPAGAKRGGVGKMILGAVIMVAAVVASPFTGGASLGAAMSATAFAGISYGSITAFGAAMFFTGISQYFQPSMKTNYESPDQRASYQLGGQVNQTSQGGPVPLAFGRIRVGTVVVSAGLTTEEVPA